ncbi:hypothetical protein PPN31114_02835 [Pandoraea pneumonica]|uniref:Uncharacterized protein n=1 Tax=Pandoraea pneumonica TaxID=2508299 RepID=A0A5E4VT82_9BURK|nr:hypothetical protein [Pandoraea pneumonica]VVE14686.1 hypothetical protein PPN31114_02835 [Pandoraea pneumonica]
MAIDQKMRLLGNFMPMGFHTFERNGQCYIPLTCIPYEWSEILPRWLLLQPGRLEHDSPDCDLMEIEPGDSSAGMALTENAWGDFICWMSSVARERLVDLEARAYNGEHIGPL